MISFQIDKLKLNNEQYLVALLSIKEMTEWQKKQAIELAANVNVENFQKEVVEHRVWGLVANNIQKLNLFADESSAVISKMAKQQIFDSMKLSRELVKVDQKFSERGIRLLVMKGPILGNELYGDVTKRTSRDLDILVSLEDIDRAMDALSELGYQTGYSNKYTPKQLECIYRQGHHFDFWDSEGREIELHWKISETMDITLEDLWENRRECAFAGGKIATLGNVEELMFLIHHGIGHGFHRMKWLIDIVEFIKQERVVLSEIIEYASNAKRLNEFLTGVFLCYAIEAFDMPDISLEQFGIHKKENNIVIDIYQEDDESLVKAVERAKKLIRAMEPIVCYRNGNRDYAVDSKEYINYYHMYVREMDYFQGKKKIQRLWERLQPGERDFNAFHLKDQYFVLYYFLRPVYWIGLIFKSWRKCRQ